MESAHEENAICSFCMHPHFLIIRQTAVSKKRGREFLELIDGTRQIRTEIETMRKETNKDQKKSAQKVYFLLFSKQSL